jgi:hypothetical protein
MSTGESSQPNVSPERPFWARVKLWVGGVGLVLCGLLWLFEVAFFVLPDPMEGLHLNSSLTLLTITLLMTVFFLVLVRSGLRGPADPLAPDERASRVQAPALPSRSNRARYEAEPEPQPEPEPEESHEPKHQQSKKPHLRLVRPAR